MLMKSSLKLSISAMTLCVYLLLAKADIKPCIPRRYDQDSVVCVCNATYCDRIDSSHATNQTSRYLSYTSTLNGQRFNYYEGSFAPKPNVTNFAEIGNQTYQDIIGFGGAFTDAATINIKSLLEETQKKLIDSYFSSSGIGYSVGRIPMASCDFSKRVYSYDDHVNDTDLNYFSLADEDLN